MTRLNFFGGDLRNRQLVIFDLSQNIFIQWTSKGKTQLFWIAEM